jgi:HK97 family phage major capsid protein
MYRDNGVWMFHDTVLARIRKLVDLVGQPLWAAGDIARGIPDTILGKPFIINQDMAQPALNAKSIAFGDFKKYIIRMVNDIRFKRMDELFAATDEIGFSMFIRVDGHVLDAGTHPIKYSVMSAT